MTRVATRSDATLLPAETVGGLISRGGTVDPAAPAIVDGDRPALTHAELGGMLERAAAALAEAGVGRGDRVAVALPDGPSTGLACLAVSTRASCVPLDPRLKAGELRALLERLAVRLIVLPEGPSAAGDAAAELGLRSLGLVEHAGGAAGRFELQGATRGRSPRRDGEEAPGAQDVAFLLLTSGSTATPKVVALTHRNVTTSARWVVRSLDLRAEDRCLSTLPLFHVGGLIDLLLAPLSAGGSVAFAPALSAARFADTLRAYDPTWYQAVPTMLHAILDGIDQEPGAPRSHALRLVRSVSAPLPEGLRRRVEARLGVPVIEIYGMTETAGLITSNPLPPAERRPGSVGRSAGPEVAIMDERGCRVDANVSGEVVVRGASVMSGYEGLAEQPFRDGWLRTGDVGHVDDDGYLYLAGRTKEIINRGGEKVSPAEVDRVLLEHPAVLDAAAFAVAHETLGEEVAAAVVVRPGAQLDDAELLRAVAERLAYYKVPRRIVRVDALPRGPGGKLLRRVLAERWGRPGAESHRCDYEAPSTPLGRLLAEVWQEVLDVTRVGVHDDFFDLGGDSLRAVELFVALERRTGLRADVSTIFDAPTISALEPVLLVELAALGAEASEVPRQRSGRTPVDGWIATQMAGWSGVRASNDSLIVGRNTHGSKRPLFWCVQVAAEIDELERHLDPDRPLYGMRSLFRLPGKGARENEALAARYTDDILAVRPSGPYLIGGYCEGGKVAFRVAKRLEELGHRVELLCLQEQFVAEPWGGAVAMFFGGVGEFSPYRYFSSPELGWSKLYTGPLRVHRSSTRHHEFYRRPHAREFATQLERALAWAEAGAPEAAKPGSRLQVLPAGAHRARLRVDAPWMLRPGQSCSVRVRVKNLGPVTWLPTDHSGLTISNRWLGLGGKVHVWLDGSARLTEALEPGGSTAVDLVVTAPIRGGAWRLEVDVVEQGVAWFQDRGSRPVRAMLAVVPALEREAR